MKQEIKQLIEDIKKVQEAQVLLDVVKTTKIESNINILIDYALRNNIIRTTEDIMDICLHLPELKRIISQKYDSYINDILTKTTSVSSYNYDKRYSGTYEKLSDVPGYGTEWNSRCIPDGVIIKRC